MNEILKQTLVIIRTALADKRYRAIQIVTSVSFALVYMIFTGIFIFTQRAIPDQFSIPYFYLSHIQTPFGYIPWWVVIYLDRHLIFSMTFEAMLFTAVISTLVGINLALLAFRLNSSRYRVSCKSPRNSIGFLGIIPAFLSVFACCGGGILVMLFGGAVLTSLFPYGDMFGVISIIILAIGILLTSKELHKIQSSNVASNPQT